MNAFPVAEEPSGPVLREAIPAPSRLEGPRGNGHVVARCNSREVYVTTPVDFEVLLTHLQEMIRG